MEYFNKYYVDVLKKYAVFSGRARRKEYWMFFLISPIVSIVLGIITSTLKLEFISTLYSLAILIPSLAVGVRRLHDTNRSGGWLLIGIIPIVGTVILIHAADFIKFVSIGIIPIVGTIILIVFLAQDSKPGSNEYGPNPKEGMGSSTAPSSSSMQQSAPSMSSTSSTPSQPPVTPPNA